MSLSLPVLLCLQGVVAPQVAELQSPGQPVGSEFATAVAFSGDTLAVGAPSERAVHVYVRQGVGWTHQATLAGFGVGDVGFGWVVAFSGDRIAVGTHSASAVWTFVRNGATWSEEQRIPNLYSQGWGGFGYSVGLSGDRMVIGAPFAWQSDGAFFELVRDTIGWELLRERGGPLDCRCFVGRYALLEGEIVGFGGFGYGFFEYLPNGTTAPIPTTVGGAPGASAIGDGLIVLGNHLDGDQGAAAGAVLTYRRSGPSWTLEPKLFASDPRAGDEFGWGLAMDGSTLVVLARNDVDAGGPPGSAYVFERVGQAWVERGEFALPLGSPPGFSSLGTYPRVDLAGRTLALGYPRPWNDPHPSLVVIHELVELGSFCDASDGALDACPCSNPGLPDTGCDLAQGTGGVRLGLADLELVPTPVATLEGSGFPPAGQPTILPIRAAAIDPRAPIVFGNGLRCVGIPVARLAATQASGGASTHVVPHDVGPGSFHYQLWFRDTPASFCTSSGFNLSNGLTIAWP